MKTKLTFSHLFWILPLFLIMRGVYLYFTHPHFLFTYMDEELYRGAFAKDLLEGLKLPLFDYRPDDFAGGFFVVGAIAALFFIIFGGSLFSLKLTSVLISGLALFFWHQTLARFVSKNTAVIFSLLFIFAPAAFIRFTLTPLGDHPETILFTGIIIFLVFKVLYPVRHPEKTMMSNRVWYALLGLVSGFSLWFAYISIFTILAATVFWFLHDRFFWKSKAFVIHLVFFGIGFSPWILSNVHSGMAGLWVHDNTLWQLFSWKAPLEVFQSWRSFIVVELLSSLGPWRWGLFERKLVTYFYVITLILPVSYALWISKKRALSFKSPIVFFVLYLLLFCFINQFANFRTQRYFIPAQPFLFACVAFCFDQMTSGTSKLIRRIGMITCLMLLVLGTFQLIPRFSLKHAGSIFGMTGHSPLYYPFTMPCAKSGECFDNAMKLSTDSVMMTRIAEDQAYAWMDRLPSKEEIKALEIMLGPANVPFFYYTLGRIGSQVSAPGQEVMIELGRIHRAEYREGKELFNRWRRNPLDDSILKAPLEKTEPEERRDLLYGMGIGYEKHLRTHVHFEWIEKDLKDTLNEEDMTALENGRSFLKQVFHD